MAMRETVRSLQAYFILSGLASLFFSGSALRVSLQGPVTITTVVEVIGIGFSLAFLYVGISLTRLLRSSARHIVALLYASTGWSASVYLLSLLQGLSPSAWSVGLVAFILALLILWYLLKNVRRLAPEAQVSSSITAPSADTKRDLLLIRVLLVAGLFAFGLRYGLEKQVRRRREAAYESAVRSYAQVLKPGMTRKEVEGYFRAKKLDFRQTCCVDTKDYAKGSWDDLIKIGEEDAPWYCSSTNVYVGFQFTGPGDFNGMWRADDLDKLKAVTLYRAAICL